MSDDRRVSARTLHACPGGCGQPVQQHMLACPDDWRRLPAALKTVVLRGYRNRRTDPAAHRAAVLDATNWYRAHPTRSA